VAPYLPNSVFFFLEPNLFQMLRTAAPSGSSCPSSSPHVRSFPAAKRRRNSFKRKSDANVVFADERIYYPSIPRGEEIQFCALISIPSGGAGQGRAGLDWAGVTLRGSSSASLIGSSSGESRQTEREQGGKDQRR